MPAVRAAGAVIYMEIFKEFQIEAAHRLPNVPPQHKCARLHGHSFRIRVYIRGPVGGESGWVTDFADISHAFSPLHAVLDHNYLNDIDGLENPTSENLSRWIWNRLVTKLQGLSKIEIWETCTAGCAYSGE